MFLRALAAAAAALLLAAGARAGEVVAHPSVRLDPADIRDVYLGERQIAGEVKLRPVDNVAAHEEFLASVLQTTRKNYQARWTRKSFREGLIVPPLKGSDVEVLSFVRSTPGAVGYISGSAGPDAGVQVLHRF